MLGNSREGFEAYEQLAIYYERHAREPHRAAVWSRKKALAELRPPAESYRAAQPRCRPLPADSERGSNSRLARVRMKDVPVRTLLAAKKLESLALADESN